MTPDRIAQITALLGQLAGLLTEDARPHTAQRNEPAAPPARVLLTVEQAAERLGLGKTKTYSFVMSGELESVRIGRLRRVHVDAIAAIAARLVAAQNTSRHPAA
jgi:excisionase family DNA binding protein